MPSIQITIDSYNFRIDSTDRNTIRHWLGEMVSRMHVNSYVTFQVYPLVDEKGEIDWPVADSRFITRRYTVSALGIEEFYDDLKTIIPRR